MERRPRTAVRVGAPRVERQDAGKARWSGPVLALLVALSPVAALGSSQQWSGADRAQIVLPAGISVESYANNGYELVVERSVATVDVALTPLGSRARFRMPAAESSKAGAVERVARSVTSGARTQHEAVGRILRWVESSISYELDRSLDQSPGSVLERRSAYCTGTARLSVALLRAVGLEAREVSGWVASDVSLGIATVTTEEEHPSSGGYFHRWVEVHYDDVGWVFSDPQAYHDFVPATYVRLAKEEVAPSAGLGGVLLERHDRRTPWDQRGAQIGATPARANDLRRSRGSLSVRGGPWLRGPLSLEGGGHIRTRTAAEGEVTFVDLDAGSYTLRYRGASGAFRERTFEIRSTTRVEVQLRR